MAVWCYENDLFNPKLHYQIQKRHHYQLTLSSKQLHVTTAKAFNTYFSSVARKLIQKLPENNHLAQKDPLINLNSNSKTPISSLRFKYTTTHEVNSVIQSLKIKDSYGYDEISSRILKISAPYILSPLTYIINKILSTGIFPERLKFSEIRLVHKKRTYD